MIGKLLCKLNFHKVISEYYAFGYSKYTCLRCKDTWVEGMWA